MRINAWRHRVLQPARSGQKVHLGPGQGNYLEGWINLDANFISAKIDLWADAAGTLPFRSDSIEAFYSHHVIEHFHDAQLPAHFSEMFRCLEPGGVVRVGGPNCDSAILKFLAGDRDWFSDFPDKRTSIGGRFANFILCRGEHLSILTFSYLDELASNAGFIDIQSVHPARTTHYPDIFAGALTKEWESDPDYPHTLIIEARKPFQPSTPI